eukprot:7413014-Pyramimonas_sp.AAC.1
MATSCSMTTSASHSFSRNHCTLLQLVVLQVQNFQHLGEAEDAVGPSPASRSRRTSCRSDKGFGRDVAPAGSTDAASQALTGQSKGAPNFWPTSSLDVPLSSSRWWLPPRPGPAGVAAPRSVGAGSAPSGRRLHLWVSPLGTAASPCVGQPPL